MKTPYSTTTPRFLLLGDSHAGVIGKAAKLRQVPFSGGPLGAGRDFGVDFFRLSTDDVIFRDGDMQQLYRQALAQLDVLNLGQVAVPLVSTIGPKPALPGDCPELDLLPDGARRIRSWISKRRAV